MKKLLTLICIIIIITLTACSTSTGDVPLEQLEKVSVRLPVPVYDAAFTHFFAALDQGYYAEQGLEVQFNFASSETNPGKMVGIGADDFGVLGGPDTLLVARSRGRPLKAFAIMHQYSHFPVLVTREDSNITKVEQLEGKKIGILTLIVLNIL